MIATAVGISLAVGCDYAACAEFAGPLLKQLGSGKYDECSVLEIPESIGEWRAEHRTARKRASHARRLNFYGCVIKNRADFEDDVYRINTSAKHRQGRPMSPGYLTRPSFNDPEWPCPLHGVHAYGVRLPKDGVMGAGPLVAYLWMYRAGELALVSQILGHADYLKSDIMFPLFEAALLGEIQTGPGYIVYNRHDSGTDGLRQWKEWQGFEERAVEWLP